MCCSSSLYCTVQFRCVQIAENARNSPPEVRIKIPGRVPNLKIVALLGFNPELLPATTLFYCASLIAGGMRNSKIGYRIDSTVAPRLMPNIVLMNERRAISSNATPATVWHVTNRPAEMACAP